MQTFSILDFCCHDSSVVTLFSPFNKYCKESKVSTEPYLLYCQSNITEMSAITTIGMTSTIDANEKRDDEETNETKTIQIGSFVKVFGLEHAPHLNGRIGYVQGDKNSTTGRFPVQLEGSYMSPTTGLETQELILLEEVNLSLAFKAQSCDGCGQTFEQNLLTKCSKCRMVRYCSPQCQRDDWKRKHQNYCETLRRANDSRKIGSENTMPTNQVERVYAIQARALRHCQTGDYEAAERDYRALLDEGFRTLGTYVNLGSCLISCGRPDEAIPYYEKAIELAPLEGNTERGRSELKVAYDMLGSTYMRVGNKKKALKTYKKGIEVFPGDPDLTRIFERTFNKYRKKK